MVPIPKHPLCDFCSGPAGPTCFLTEDRSLTLTSKGTTVTLNSDDHWISCTKCAALVRAKDAEGLLARSFANQPPAIPRDSISRNSLLTVQTSLFWAGFRGNEHPTSEHPLIEEDPSGPKG